MARLTLKVVKTESLSSNDCYYALQSCHYFDLREYVRDFANCLNLSDFDESEDDNNKLVNNKLKTLAEDESLLIDYELTVREQKECYQNLIKQ